MCVAAMAAMALAPDWFSQLIFGDAGRRQAVSWLAAGLAIVIWHNFLTSLFIAVRMYRIVTWLQFLQSVCFAAISLALLAVWPAGAVSIIVGYSAATLISALGSYHWLRGLTELAPRDQASAPQGAFWAKLLPFAMWMWLSNLLANLFEVIDRYMIIHHGGMGATEALRQVGYYHSSRIVPLLFVGVASLLGSLITPHLTHDWEAGRRESVTLRLNLALKLLLFSLFAASLAVLFLAPYLFNVAFQNKFQGGLEVLPWTLTYCAWFGTVAVAQNYLWCAERPGLTSVALLLGLVLNVACNLVLLPRYGLEGAVWSTTLANLATLCLTYLFSAWQGMRVDFGTWLLTLSLAAIALGPWAASGVLVTLAVAALAGLGILSDGERRQLRDLAGQGLLRARRAARQLGLVSLLHDRTT
jgi:O-antigen/teichoic acid export membrane protein